MSMIGVYGGSFDVPTTGHSQIIKKACSIFDKLYVVIGTNSSKKPSFPVADRIEMLRDTILEIHSIERDKVTILTLPENMYLADFAMTKKANFLVRGIRDSMDFHYENQIYHTNKLIAPIETIYLMPDEAFSLVSSSWVKSLIGQRSWRKVVGKYVSTLTLKYLVTQYAERRFRSFVEKNANLFRDLCPAKVDSIWKTMLEMNKNEYHNLNHVISCLETMDSLLPNNKAAELAFWFHDVYPEVDRCINFASSILYGLTDDFKDTKDMVKTLINATKHDTCKYTTEMESMVASIDLMVLASNAVEYGEYRFNVYMEYFKKSGLPESEFQPKWIEGRSKFIKQMLAREKIFTYSPFYDRFESVARENLTHELHSI